MVVYQTDLVKEVAHQTGLSQRVVSDVLRSSHQLIQQTLAAGETVTFPGFGTFYTRAQPAGTVRHIRTRKPVRVPAHRVAAFRVGAVLRRAVRGAVPSQRRRWW